MEYEGEGWMGDGSARSWTSAKKSHPSDHLTKGVLGNWEGSLVTPDGTFRVAVHIWPDASGNLTGTVDDVDHDANDVPLTSTTLKNSALHFEAAGGSYDGTLGKDESTIEGTWAQHGASIRLQLKRVEYALKARSRQS
jgi:hypothetical protein